MAASITTTNIAEISPQVLRVTYTLDLDGETLEYGDASAALDGLGSIGSNGPLVEGVDQTIDITCEPGIYESVDVILGVYTTESGYIDDTTYGITVTPAPLNSVSIGPVDVDGYDVSYDVVASNDRVADSSYGYTYAYDAYYTYYATVSPDDGTVYPACDVAQSFSKDPAGDEPWYIGAQFYWDMYGYGYIVESAYTDLEVAQDALWTYGAPVVAPPSIESVDLAYDGTEVSFTIDTAAGDYPIASQVIEFGDTQQSAFTDNTPIAHNYASIAQRTATITVTDTEDNTTQQQVVLWTPPTVSIGSPTIDGLDVTVTATASVDTGATIATATLDWDEGTPVNFTSETPEEHTYAAAGSYTLSATVTDSRGASTTVTRGVVLPMSFTLLPEDTTGYELRTLLPIGNHPSLWGSAPDYTVMSSYYDPTYPQTDAFVPPFGSASLVTMPRIDNGHATVLIAYLYQYDAIPSNAINLQINTWSNNNYNKWNAYTAYHAWTRSMSLWCSWFGTNNRTPSIDPTPHCDIELIKGIVGGTLQSYPIAPWQMNQWGDAPGYDMGAYIKGNMPVTRDELLSGVYIGIRLSNFRNGGLGYSYTNWSTQTTTWGMFRMPWLLSYELGTSRRRSYTS